MREVEEHRSYPKSVQAGIPKRASAPLGWSVFPMSKLLAPVKRRVEVRDDDKYQLVTAKRNRGGIVEREVKHGREIRTQTQFRALRGDFLISRRQIAHGACGFVPDHLDGSLVSNEYATLLPTDCIDAGFLRHLPHSVYFQQTCFHSSIGVHVEKLVFDLEDWLAWEFNTPPLSEQRRIAAVLDAWDAAIATSERLIAAKRQHKAALLEEIFAPVLNIGRRESSDWTKVTVGKLADVRGGATPSTSELSYWGGSVQWCTPTDLTNLATRHIENTKRTLTEKGLKASSASLLPAGSIILCSRASVGECAINTVPMATNQGFQSLIPNRKEDAAFLYYMMQAAKRLLLRIAAGSTFLEFSRSELRKLAVAAPDESSRDRIGLQFSSIDDEIALISRRTKLLRQQKRGLMQRLLNGEIPVPESIDNLMPAETV